MKIQQQLTEDMKQAMRERKENPQRLAVIRMIVDRIQKKEKETQIELTQDETIQILQTFKKQNNEEMDGHKQANNHAQVEKLVADNKIIDSYLPQQMSKEDVTEAVRQIVNQTQEVGNNVGALMKTVMTNLKGKADNKTISEVVKEIFAKKIK